MITVRAETIGAPEVAARIEALKPGILAGVKGALDTWSEELANYIKEDKLSGNPLHQRSGALRESITPYRRDEGDILQGGAGGGAGLVYAHILEYGGDIYPVRAKALRFVIDGNVIFSKHVRMPEFNYMRSSFEANADAGVQAIRDAVQEAVLA
jgi:phage gpG-like protein